MRVNLNRAREEASAASSSPAEVLAVSMEGKGGHLYTSRVSGGTLESASLGISRDFCTTSQDPHIFPPRPLSFP